MVLFSAYHRFKGFALSGTRNSSMDDISHRLSFLRSGNLSSYWGEGLGLCDLPAQTFFVLLVQIIKHTLKMLCVTDGESLCENWTDCGEKTVVEILTGLYPLAGALSQRPHLWPLYNNRVCDWHQTVSSICCVCWSAVGEDFKNAIARIGVHWSWLLKANFNLSILFTSKTLSFFLLLSVYYCLFVYFFTAAVSQRNVK